MRKKIPTITRPDTAYAASLRQEVEEILGREGELRAALFLEPVRVTAAAGDEGLTLDRGMPAAPPRQPEQDTAAGITLPAMASSPRIRRIPATRKIDIRVNALERQEEALIDCGVDPAHVIRAALRRAVKSWKLGAHFVAPFEERRTRITEWRARTSLAVDAGALGALLRDQDPLDVLSKWTLIRGQVEPRVWAEVDQILFQLGKGAEHPNDAEGAPPAHRPAQGANDPVE